MGTVPFSPHLLGRRDVAVGTGYASCEEALAHFGLGPAVRCDVVVTWAGRKAVRRDVGVNQFIAISYPKECSP